MENTSNSIDDYLVSVIVPVYNMENTLGKCLDSIIKQTYQKIEIVLIDDGSIDGSGRICSDYQKKDRRIKYYSRENKGIATTYKEGIDHALGTFILFVDSDDYIDLKTVEVLVFEQKKTNADVVEVGISYENAKYVQVRKLSFNRKTIDDRKELIFEYFFTGRMNKTFAGNLIRKVLFDNVFFTPNARSIDLQTLPFVYSKCRRFVQVNGEYYHTLINLSSISRGELSDDAYEDKKLCTHILDVFFKEEAPEYYEYMYYRYCIIACTMYERIMHSAIISDKNEKKKECKVMFNRYYKKYANSSICNGIEQKERIKIKLFRISPILYSTAYLIRKKMLKVQG